MSKFTAAIIDGGGANIASLQFALARLGCEGTLTVDQDEIRRASHVILPGVGAARNAMNRLIQHDLVGCIRSLEQPVLGICLGLQLLFDASEENDTHCLGILHGKARRFVPDPNHTVPHMGWNRVGRTGHSNLLDGIPDGTYFYFVHSYALDVSEDTVGSTEYGWPFSAVVEQENFAATQFHPERSGRFGSAVLENFLRL
jgi:glutamine amidotransferase